MPFRFNPPTLRQVGQTPQEAPLQGLPQGVQQPVAQPQQGFGGTLGDLMQNEQFQQLLAGFLGGGQQQQQPMQAPPPIQYQPPPMQGLPGINHR
jgi:hypothetical protein